MSSIWDNNTTTGNVRGRKFPLTLHSSGQSCKEIKGHRYYFGTDKQAALQLFHERASQLHTERGLCPDAEQLTMRTLCNLYLRHQETRVKAKSLTHKQFYHCTVYLTWWAKYIGPDRLVSSIKAINIADYRAKLIAEGKAANTVNNCMAPIKAMFNWVVESEVLGIDRLQITTANKVVNCVD